MGGKKKRFEQCDELRQISFATQSLQPGGAQSASVAHDWRTVAEQCWRSICVVLLIVEAPTRTSLSHVAALPSTRMLLRGPGGLALRKRTRRLTEPLVGSPGTYCLRFGEMETSSVGLRGAVS